MAATYPLGGRDGGTLSFETYVAQDADQGDIDVLMDKLETVASRQLLKGVLADKKMRLDQSKEQLASMLADFTRVEKHYTELQEKHFASGRRNPPAVTGKELEHKLAVEQNIQLTKANIDKLESDIQELTNYLLPPQKEAAE